MACLDTTVLIDLGGRSATRRTRAFRKLKELTDRGETLVTTRFNVAELYVGVARSDDPQREERAIRALLGDLGLLEFDERAARACFSAAATCLPAGRQAGPWPPRWEERQCHPSRSPRRLRKAAARKER